MYMQIGVGLGPWICKCQEWPESEAFWSDSLEIHERTKQIKRLCRPLISLFREGGKWRDGSKLFQIE